MTANHWQRSRLIEKSIKRLYWQFFFLKLAVKHTKWLITLRVGDYYRVRQLSHGRVNPQHWLLLRPNTCYLLIFKATPMNIQTLNLYENLKRQISEYRESTIKERCITEWSRPFESGAHWPRSRTAANHCKTICTLPRNTAYFKNMSKHAFQQYFLTKTFCHLIIFVTIVVSKFYLKKTFFAFHSRMVNHDSLVPKMYWHEHTQRIQNILVLITITETGECIDCQ